MNPQQERIVASFESMKKLLCDLGHFVEGDKREGVYVRYWGNRRLRELSCYRGGVKDGLSVRVYSPNHSPHYSLFRGGVEETPPSADQGQDYLATDEEEELFRKYARHPLKAAFM